MPLDNSAEINTQIVSGDTILAFRPPPVGTKMSWRVARQRSVEVFDSEVVSHNDTFKGQKVWTVRGQENNSHWTYAYNRLGRTEFDGSEKETSTPSRELYRFPMKPGDSWTNTYRQTERNPDRSLELTAEIRVVGWENVTTPAGKFKAMKIVRKFKSIGRNWTNTTWYSPEHGTDVKGNDTWQGGRASWTLVKLQMP